MTKYIALGAIAALVLGTTAGSAADLPMKAKAPPLEAIYDWTGFLHWLFRVADLWGRATHIDRATGLGDTIGYNVKGGLVGGTLGYNWQMGPLVVGLEGDVSWVGEYGSHIDDGLAGVRCRGVSPFQSFTKEPGLGTRTGSSRLRRQQPAVLRDRRLRRCGR